MADEREVTGFTLNSLRVLPVVYLDQEGERASGSPEVLPLEIRYGSPEDEQELILFLPPQQASDTAALLLAAVKALEPHGGTQH